MGNHHSSTYPGKPRKNVHWKTAEKPGSPGKPEIIPLGSEDEPNAVTLRWSVPRHDGGAPIQGFQVECNRIGSAAWIHTSPPVINKPELILTGLESGYRYQFRVSALNAVSCSDPSELSDILTISNDHSTFTAPKFLTHLEDVVAMENDTSTFKVTFDGVPPPTIAWFKDGFEIFSSRRTVISTDENSSVLVFHQTHLSDEGEIKCTATNRAGHAVSRSKLMLHAPPKLRYPRQYEDGLLYEVNETIFLKTSVVGKPIPEVEWRHDGQLLTEDNRIEITKTPKLSALRIRSASRNDRGEYQVNARNEIGEDSVSFLVTVTAPPEPPRKLTVTRQIDKSVTLTWVPPEDDGGCRIGNYVLEYYRKGWDVWLKATTSRKLSVTLFDLIEGSEYRFRVKAESPYGMSEPSEESAPVRIPGQSVDSHFLAVESRIINDVLRREDGEETTAASSSLKADSFATPPPLVSPRRKKTETNKVVENRPETSNREIESKVRVNSTEFMLVLCPEQDKSDADKRRSFQLDLEEALSPPPLSYSMPELNTRFNPFPPLRNSVSSTELLHERAMDRFYRVVALKEERTNQQNSIKEEKSKIEKPTIQPALQIPVKETTPTTTLEIIQNESSERFSQEPSRQWQSISFDEDYTASTVSIDDSEELSQETSLDNDHDRITQLCDEEITYNPREKFMRSPTPPHEDRAVELLSKPAPLPDPNFIPKPILKRREIEQTEQPIELEKKPEKLKLFKKITKMPEMPKIPKSFPFTKKENKKGLEKLNAKLESMESNGSSNTLNKKKSNGEDKTKLEDEKELDEGQIVIQYYGDIVKEYGSHKKPSTPLYLKTEDLKKVAEEQEKQEKTKIKPKPVKPKQIKTTKNHAPAEAKPKTSARQNIQKNVKGPMSVSNKQKPTEKKVIQKEKMNTQVVLSEESKDQEENEKVTKRQKVVLKTAARASIVIPIDYEQLELQAKQSVRSAIDYTIDFCLLLLAFWFYFFKDERLSIPLVVLLIYRQIHQILFRNIPDWVDKHTPTWMKSKSS